LKFGIEVIDLTNATPVKDNSLTESFVPEDNGLKSVNMILRWNQLKEPTLAVGAANFAVGAINIILVVFLLFSWRSLERARTASFLEAQDFEEAMSLARRNIDKAAYQDAYDLILVASRLKPSDPGLFGLVLTFAEKAQASDEEDAALLAEDLLSRGDSLIHYQAPSRVADARRRLLGVRERASKVPDVKEDPCAEALDLLRVAENKKLPVHTRSKAAEQSRSTLDNHVLMLALSERAAVPSSDSNDRIEKIRQRIDAAEQDCIVEMFLKTRDRVNGWLEKAKVTVNAADVQNPKGAPGPASVVTQNLDEGANFSQELSPYLKSEVSGAAELAEQVDRQVASLQQAKAWLYNHHALEVIRGVEAQKGLNPTQKIENLASIDELRLAPYVLRRHNEEWEKVFEPLDMDRKVWAMKTRLLGTKK
jgi:hypothetical protein